jgi:hypothetical protein
MRADVSFWHAYAIKNDIRSYSSNRAFDAARRWSYLRGETAIVITARGREVMFMNGLRV